MAVLASAALGAQSPGAWPIASAPRELRPIIAKADLMIVAMQSSVLRELAEALGEGDAARAMRSCHIDSRLVTQRITREGAKAGRTSHRLRNPMNAPPTWAKPFVEGYAGRQSRDVKGFVVDLGDQVGILRPISQQPVCANCHGPVDELTEAVRQAISTRYPQDRAVGFAQGEIRGWFWVEIPRNRR